MMMNPIFALILRVLDIYMWIIIVAVVMSWLVAFRVINVYNNVVRAVMRALDAMTEPVFRLVRRVIPPIGGLDLSPLIVIVAIWFLQYVIIYLHSTLGFL